MRKIILRHGSPSIHEQRIGWLLRHRHMWVFVSARRLRRIFYRMQRQGFYSPKTHHFDAGMAKLVGEARQRVKSGKSVHLI